MVDNYLQRRWGSLVVAECSGLATDIGDYNLLMGVNEFTMLYLTYVNRVTILGI